MKEIYRERVGEKGGRDKRLGRKKIWIITIGNKREGKKFMRLDENKVLILDKSPLDKNPPTITKDR